MSFYLEKTEGDIELPFVNCRKVMGSIHLITSDYSKPAKLEWKKENDLYIDGRKREYNFDITDEDTESDITISNTSSKETSSKETSSKESSADSTSDTAEADE